MIDDRKEKRMYVVIVGNEIITWEKTFKAAEKTARMYDHLHNKIPVWITKVIVKDGVIFDK